MANRKNRKASELKGIGVYQDPKKGTILYDFLTKKGYQITTSDVPNYTISKSFLPVAVIIFYILYVMIKLDFVKSIVIAVVSYVVMRILYRVKFLNKLPYIENYVRPDSEGLLTRTARDYSYMRLNLLSIMSFAIVILSIIYIKTTELETIKYYGFLLLTLAAVLMFIFSTTAFIIKRKNNK